MTELKNNNRYTILSLRLKILFLHKCYKNILWISKENVIFLNSGIFLSAAAINGFLRSLKGIVWVALIKAVVSEYETYYA